MIRTLTMFFAVTLVSGFVNQNEADTERSLNDKELSSLRGKFGLLFEPDANRGESRTALRHILTFLSKRPGAIKPQVPAAENVCGGDDANLQWNGGPNGGYSAKSLLPEIIGSMKEEALYNVF